MRPSLLGINAPRTRRQAIHPQRPAQRISLHIDEVVLDGFERVKGGPIHDALRQSLTSTLQGGAQFALRAGADAQQIGAVIGKTLNRTLTQALQSKGRG
jgi:hypothetical protein